MAKKKTSLTCCGGRNKYGNTRVGSHASKKEHHRAAVLQVMQRAGLISDLREQVSYELIPAQYGTFRASECRVELAPALPSAAERRGLPTCGKDFKGKTTKVCLEKSVRYIADFVYTDNETGQEVVEDTKGVRTKEYIIKRKLMLWIHGIRIKEI